MPLKPDDLKTVDTYKKALKMDGARISPSSKIKFWIYRDVELPTAGGQKQKLPVFLALIDDKPVKPLLKKNPVCKGLCGLHEGKIAFETEQGKVPYKQLKVSVPLLLGKMAYIPANAPDDDTEDSETEDGQPASSAKAAVAAEVRPTSPTPPNAAQWNAALQQLEQRAQQAIAANPAQRATLAPMVVGIRERLASGDFGEARKRMDALNAVLKAPAASPASGAAGPARAAVQVQPGALIKYRQALLQFAQAKSEVKQQVAALKAAILKVGPQKAAFADKLAAKLEKLNAQVDDAVNEAMTAAKNEAAPANDKIKLKIRKYLVELASDPLVKKVERNPLGVKVTIAKTLGGALARINEAMPA